MNTQKQYKFHSDPSHGWLAVTRKDLQELGVLEKISKYSYQKGTTVYLEEDCDMVVFCVAYFEKTGKRVRYSSGKVYDTSHRIRNYEKFQCFYFEGNPF